MILPSRSVVGHSKFRFYHGVLQIFKYGKYLYTFANIYKIGNMHLHLDLDLVIA